MRRHWKPYLLALGFLLGAISNALAEGPINARGDIVGRYVADGVSHAYLLSGGQFSTIDFPGAILLQSGEKSGVVLPAPSEVKRIGWPAATCLM